MLFGQGECAGVHIHRILMQQRFEARRPSPNVNASSGNPASFLASSSADLLKLVDADFALLSIDDKTAILSYLQSCQFNNLRCSTNITADFPGLSYAPGLKTICGLLFIPLNVGGGNDFLVFFRKGQQKHVKWAGYVSSPRILGQLLKINLAGLPNLRL
jgi:light-regulated signal transduction histidine kinase (bacteriophytochrome)